MTAVTVVEGGVTVVLGGVTVVFGDDSPTPPISPTMGFDVYRNGVLVTFPYAWDNHQLASINLPTATADATVAVGSVTVPGDPGWVAGDRITWKDDLGNLLHTSYVMSHARNRNLASPTEVETTWQLFDVNRQLIGRKVVDWVRPEETSLERLMAWIAAFTPPTGPLAIDLDLTYIYGFGGVTLTAKTYTGDGITDLLADLILYTGYTIFLVPSQTENRFQFHYSQPAVPLVTAGLTVTDVGIPDEIDVWGLSQPHAAYEAADMKNDVTGQNGTAEYGFTNTTSITSHDAGGLFFQQVVQYAVDFPDLQILVNNILNAVTGAGEEKPTYSFSIENLTGSDVIRVPPGSAILITSGVLGISGVRYPITHHTLTVSKDLAGLPIPGFWDVALEVSSQLRHPSAVLGYGGQGGDSGRLSEDFSIADHINVTQPDQLPPVGFSMIVEGQVVDDIERAIKNNSGVAVNWTLYQWQDEAGTVPATAWSLDDVTTYTDAKGVALIILSHDNADPWSWVFVHGELA